ncbi:MAG: aldo/keto reductase, partial [Desulfarculaceae bacterium]
MKKIRLGRTGLMVSEIGFGGIPVTRLDLQEAVDLIAYCFEKGINFFDTANMYGDSEEKIGRALEDVRDQVILATKSRKLDGGGLKEHMTRSLEMLRTDYIDLFQIHNLSKPEELERALAPGGACEALAQAKDEGIIRHIGFSSHNPDTALKACRTGLFTTVQIPFNFVEPQVEEKVFAAAREMDMGLIAMKPLGGGLLDRADLCFAFLRQYPD